MTAVEDRLAATLVDHYSLTVRDDGETWECLCGVVIPEPDEGAHSRHVAAVIASSDDLAVIELSKPNEREDGDNVVTWGEGYNDLQVGVHDEYADQVQVWVDYVPIEPWSPREAVEFASHLLAAAKAAEGVSDRA